MAEFSEDTSFNLISSTSSGLRRGEIVNQKDQDTCRLTLEGLLIVGLRGAPVVAPSVGIQHHQVREKEVYQSQFDSTWFLDE